MFGYDMMINMKKSILIFGIGAVLLLSATIMPTTTANVSYIIGGGVMDHDRQQCFNADWWLNDALMRLSSLEGEARYKLQADICEVKQMMCMEREYHKLDDDFNTVFEALKDCNDLNKEMFDFIKGRGKVTESEY